MSVKNVLDTSYPVSGGGIPEDVIFTFSDRIEPINLTLKFIKYGRMVMMEIPKFIGKKTQGGTSLVRSVQNIPDKYKPDMDSFCYNFMIASGMSNVQGRIRVASTITIGRDDGSTGLVPLDDVGVVDIQNPITVVYYTAN